MSSQRNTMTEFDNINTVDDLIKQNKKKNPAEEILKLVYQLDPADGLIIVQDILNNLSNFHGSAIENYKSKNETQNAAVWAYDKAVIDAAQELLTSVEL